ncbi:MAG: hypothetical protein KZQ81_17305 [Candidatus Thiodiazotropha sp. (ex Rostrolucina anterorostrata)]|nr:hypothetical protein [Candidatus Thiodiazotropha sp. (ex Rostrolucina anterorostrata)]
MVTPNQPEVIGRVIGLYHPVAHSFRDVEDLLANLVFDSMMNPSAIEA